MVTSRKRRRGGSGLADTFGDGSRSFLLGVGASAGGSGSFLRFLGGDGEKSSSASSAAAAAAARLFALSFALSFAFAPDFGLLRLRLRLRLLLAPFALSRLRLLAAFLLEATCLSFTLPFALSRLRLLAALLLEATCLSFALAPDFGLALSCLSSLAFASDLPSFDFSAVAVGGGSALLLLEHAPFAFCLGSAASDAAAAAAARLAAEAADFGFALIAVGEASRRCGDDVF